MFLLNYKDNKYKHCIKACMLSKTEKFRFFYVNETKYKKLKMNFLTININQLIYCIYHLQSKF